MLHKKDDGIETYIRKISVLQRLVLFSKINFFCFQNICQPDGPVIIHVSFYHRAIDLVDSIVTLHVKNLVEPSLALVRILFENHLKYCFFIDKSKEIGSILAMKKYFESIVIEKHHAALQQDKTAEGNKFSFQMGYVSSIFDQYDKETLDKIRLHGFPQKSIKKLAKNYNLSHEYHLLYKNYSRNIHASDFQEYFFKLDETEYIHKYTLRNRVALDICFRLFSIAMLAMDGCLELSNKQQLIKILEEYPYSN